DPNARWSDGQAVTAADIIATYKLLIDEGLKDPFTNSLYAETFEEPVAESKYIVKINCKKENWRSFLYFAVSTKIYPASHLAKTNGAGYITKYQFDFMPGTGPYELDKENTRQGERLTLKRRPNYWAENYDSNIGLNNFDRITFVVVRTDELMKDKLLAGEVDWYIAPRAQWWAEELTEAKIPDIARGVIARQKIYNNSPKGTSGFALNTAKPPFDDVKVREALGLLFNFEELNQKLFFNEYVRINSFYYGTPYANPNNPKPEYNPTKALALLKEAGYTKKPGEKWLSKNGKPFTIEMMSDKSLERIFVPYQQSLADVGIELKFNNVDPNERFKKVQGKEYTIAFQNYTGLFFPNPESSMHSKFAKVPNNTNITGIADPRIDELCDLYDKSYDTKERVKFVQEIDGIAVAKKHWVWGWVSPYTLRLLYWNKFGMPENALSYAGDFGDVFSLWWEEPELAKQVEVAKKDKSLKMGKAPAEIDFWKTKGK
ncbi:MAG TPA: ABC transporter substrate-binding protein, partial [Chitinophagales bacterium]|nr:ABC transporter substrate-binding protein [Chitinophagales bacterium]